MKALVRIARVYAGENPIPAGVELYARNLKLAFQTVPLRINHDPARVIGRVTGLDTFRDTDGEWLMARAELDADAPAWVKRGTPASLGAILAERQTIGEGTYVWKGYVDEVSLLSTLTPAIPRAAVALLTDEPVPVSARRVTSVEARAARELRELRHRIDAARAAGNSDRQIDLVIEHAKQQAREGTLLRGVAA